MGDLGSPGDRRDDGGGSLHGRDLSQGKGEGERTCNQ